ncbi:hypothetical protein SH501x_000936 [Pirellulaceae bacterium SH501]
MSSIFLPLLFLPIRLHIPAVEGEGRKMKSKSSCQLSWNTTWNDMVTYCSCGSTNAVAEGDQQADYVYQTKSGCLSKFRELQKSRLVLPQWTRSLPKAMPDGP